MTIATGIGSHPGDSQDDLTAAVQLVLDELPDLPYFPEVPGRGITAGMVGRTLGLVTTLGIDLQPAGWRLTDASGVDHRRARSLLAQDLDGLEELTQGYTGAFKIQVTGPWTLAATVEKPRGDKVVSDVGARRELAQALAEGLTHHVADVRRRLGGVDRLIVQVDEPAMAAVLGGQVRTASGWGRHRTVHPPEASDTLGWVLSAITDAGAEPWVHTCSTDSPLALLRGAGARGLSVDLSMTGAAESDQLAEALEAGETVALGMISSVDAADPTTDGQVTEGVLRWLDMLGLDPGVVTGSLVVTPTCGLGGASAAWARSALATARLSAAQLT